MSSRTSHSRTESSPPLLARVVPSGLNATEKAISVRLKSGSPIGWWVATSGSRAEPSSLPVARVLPSGLNATERTPEVVAGDGVPSEVRAWARAAGIVVPVRGRLRPGLADLA